MSTVGRASPVLSGSGKEGIEQRESCARLLRRTSNIATLSRGILISEDVRAEEMVVTALWPDGSDILRNGSRQANAGSSRTASLSA